MKPGRNYRKDLIRDLRNPREASAYLNAAREAGDKKAFLLALRHVVEASGGISVFARRTGINRVSLHKILSARGNPEFETLLKIFNALGIELNVRARRNRAA